MRIIYINQYFIMPSSPGGSRGYEMARRFAASGHDVHIVTGSSKIASKVTEKHEGFTIHRLPVVYSQRMSYKERIKSFLSFAAQASVTARRLRGDVVWASSTPLTVAIPGIFATLFRIQPLVFEVRDLWPDAPIAMGALKNPIARATARVLEKITYRYSSHIVALSPDMSKAIISKGIPSQKISVIPNVSDNELFKTSSTAGRRFRDEHAWLGNRKLVLYCGTLGRVNDVSYVARLAAATLEEDESVRFLVVGQGNDEENVRETAKQLGVYENNFFMMSPLPKTEVPMIFSAADLSLSTVAPIPILNGNSANKVFDTFASGTPLGINHEGWLAELIRETGSGIVLDQSNSEIASNQLLEFLSSPEMLQSASQSAENLAYEKFDLEELAKQQLKVLEQAHSEALRRTSRG